MSEFDLIQQYFTRATPGTELGVGDDAALLRVASGMELAVSTDMLVCGTHFLPDADPFSLGHKTLAVNLSDLAAMGAQPRWALLSLSLPEANNEWLKKFSEGFFALAEQHGVELVGGDTTRGPLNLCVTIMGEVSRGGALRRDGAQPGDEIWVSGNLGDAALALAHLQGTLRLSEHNYAACSAALHQPTPRIALGLALREVAHSAIDISDGLLADLGHILERSRVGATLEVDLVPISDVLRSLTIQSGGVLPFNPADSVINQDEHTAINKQNRAHRWMLAGGDDYELCFTAPVTNRRKIQLISRQVKVPLTRIGVIVEGSDCTVRAADGSIISIGEIGYDHFR